ncbi:hypothetical protein [Maricaulis sp.]|uniref:hypothetical protein n=1 Tax=Maricaulis sp. TaxID=1486257 RepID=UPI00261C00A9|nr:hypothetical protein [Maricaulis sp.]
MENFDGNEVLEQAVGFGPTVFLISLFLLVVLVRGRQVFDGIGSMFKTILEGWAAVISARTERDKIKRLHAREHERLRSRKG